MPESLPRQNTNDRNNDHQLDKSEALGPFCNLRMMRTSFQGGDIISKTNRWTLPEYHPVRRANARISIHTLAAVTE